MYQTLALYNMSKGPEILVCYVNDITLGIFMALFFVAIWMIMTIGSFMITKRSTGSGDFAVSMSVGSWTTLIFAILMRLIDCPINPLTSDIALGVSIAITFLSVMFLFFSND